MPRIETWLGRASSFLLPLLVAAASPAEEAALRLSLPQALKLALDQNPRVHLAVLAVAESEDEGRSAASALLPALGAQAFGQRAKNNLDAFIGIPSPHGPQVVGPFNWGQVGLEARATLFDLGTWKRWKASEQGTLAAKAQGRAVREEVAALVVGQYLRALRASAALEATRSRIELAEALAALAGNQQKSGVGTRLDTLRAQVQVQNERQRLVQAQAQLRIALAGLGRLLNVEPGRKLELTDNLAEPTLPDPAFADAFAASLRQRPEMEALLARGQAAQDLRQAAQALRLPSLVASAGYASVGLQNQPWAPTFQVSLGLKVPLFTGGLISAQVARAKSEEARVEEARRETRSQVGAELQVAQAELDSARAEVEAASLAVGYAGEALQQARHRFEAGVSSNIEVIQAQDEAARAQDNRINALYRLNQARADLAKAMGQMESLFAR